MADSAGRPLKSTRLLLAALDSYAQRRLLWLVALAFLLVYAGQWADLFINGKEPSYTRAEPALPRPGIRWQTRTGTPPQSRGPIRSMELWDDTEFLHRPAHASLLADVESLTIYSRVTATNLELLARLPKLKYLSLLETTQFSAADLSRLAGSQSLRRLQILECSGYGRASEPIKWPPRLEMVVLNGAHNLPLRRIQELQELPQLRVLSVRLLPERDSHRLPADVLASLQAFPALRWLYLEEMRSIYPGMIRHTQRALPSISVRPNAFDRQLQGRASSVVYFLCIGLAVVLAQVSSQFLSIHASVVPGFARPHWQVAGVWLGVGGLLQGVYALAAGVSPVGYLGMVGAIGAYFWALMAVLRRADPATPGLAQAPVVLPFAIFSLPLLALLNSLFAAEWNWYLHGQHVWWSLLLIVAGVWGARSLALWMTDLNRQLEECGKGGAPLGGLDLAAWVEWGRQRQGPIPQRWRIQNWITGADQRLEAAIRSGGWRQLNAAADQMSLQRFVLMTGLLTIGFGICGTYGDFLFGDASIPVNGMLTGFFFYLASMAAYFPLILLFQRKPLLPQELLRPISRVDWRQSWHLRVASQLRLPLFITAMGLVTMGVTNSHASGHLIRSNWPLLSAASIFIAAVLVGVYAAMMWIVTYRHAAWLTVILVLVCVGTLLSLSLGVSLSPVRMRIEAIAASPVGLLASAACVLLIGLAIFAASWRRWYHWELAR